MANRTSFLCACVLLAGIANVLCQVLPPPKLKIDPSALRSTSPVGIDIAAQAQDALEVLSDWAAGLGINNVDVGKMRFGDRRNSFLGLGLVNQSDIDTVNDQLTSQLQTAFGAVSEPALGVLRQINESVQLPQSPAEFQVWVQELQRNVTGWINENSQTISSVCDTFSRVRPTIGGLGLYQTMVGGEATAIWSGMLDLGCSALDPKYAASNRSGRQPGASLAAALGQPAGQVPAGSLTNWWNQLVGTTGGSASTLPSGAGTATGGASVSNPTTSIASATRPVGTQTAPNVQAMQRLP